MESWETRWFNKFTITFGFLIFIIILLTILKIFGFVGSP